MTISDFQPERCVALLPARKRDAHKGDHGHVLVIGGAPGMSGAVRLAAEAAARCGAGLISVATHPEHAAFLNLTRPELMVHSIEQHSQLRLLFERSSVVAIGPGLGETLSWSRNLFSAALNSHKPLVLDADALNLLAKIKHQRDDWILTPHPGEAGRLLHCSTHSIQEDRLAAARALQQKYGGVVVLKGEGTLIASATGVTRCTQGNPGMASGGMGDVLTGVIAALLAQGLSLRDAAEVGVYCHAEAGDRAAKDGERGMLASDLYPHLRRLLNPCQSD